MIFIVYMIFKQMWLFDTLSCYSFGETKKGGYSKLILFHL